jgi:hypothetical protein
MIDVNALSAVLADLHEYIAGNSQLAAFLPAAEELRANGAALAAGSRNIAPLRRGSPPVLPDRKSARDLVEIMSRIPPIDGDEDADLVRAVARVLGNLVDGITASIFRDFPDEIPRGR